MSKKPMKETIKELEADVEYWKSRCLDKAEELSKVEKLRKEENLIECGKINIEVRYLKEENRKLWYMLRHLTNDPRIPTKNNFKNGEGLREIIDPFEFNIQNHNQLR